MKSIFIYFTGGTPHLGGMTTGLNVGDIKLSKTFSLPKHHDDVVTKKVNKIIEKKFTGISVVGAGIHYDNLNKPQIKTILQNTEKLANKLLAEVETH